MTIRELVMLTPELMGANMTYSTKLMPLQLGANLEKLHQQEAVVISRFGKPLFFAWVEDDQVNKRRFNGKPVESCSIIEFRRQLQDLMLLNFELEESIKQAAIIAEGGQIEG